MKNQYPDSSKLASLARTAGAIMKDGFRSAMARPNKADGTPVTVYDTQINRLVIDEIKKNYPHIPVIGEEECYEPENPSEFVILCDPIDATIPFCRGTPISSFVISVMHGQTSLSAVIYDPFMKRMWMADKGKGAFVNRRKLKVSNQRTIKGSYHCMCWWKSDHVLQEASKLIADAGGLWTNPLGIAYHGGLVAQGDWDSTMFVGNKGWETAAMSLIVEEAGGKATDLRGEPLFYGKCHEILNGHLISNGYLHDQLLEIISEARSH